jgi:hypothetical protein
VANIGLGDAEGQFELIVDTPTNRGGNRILLSNEMKKESSLIHVKTLDNWIKNENITNVDLMKIDVEGFELNVLKGGIETIKKYRPALFIELDNENLKAVGANARALVEFVERFNYSIVNVETGEKVNMSSSFEKCHFDIICRPN